MRYLFGKSSLGVLIFAAMAAGTVALPAVAAKYPQGDTPATPHNSSSSPKSTAAHKKTAHSPSAFAAKKTTSASTTSPTTSTAKKPVKSSSSKKVSRTKSKKVKGQTAPTPERINEIQEALASKGAFSGTPSGKWDGDTVDAMKKFQASQGLEPTGKLDALTLHKLGLGSQTAGLAAPVAPPNSVNRLRNTTSAPIAEEPSTAEPRN